MSSNSILDMIWDELNKQIRTNGQDIRNLHVSTEQAGYTDGVPAYSFNDLPTQGLADGTSYITLAFVSNGRKAGEGAGLGTGVMVYWDNASLQWLKFSDDTAVTI